MAEEVLPRGLTASDWIVALAVFCVGLLVGHLARLIVVRRIGGPESDVQAGVLVGRFAGMVCAVAGLIYALAILRVRLAPLLGAVGIGGIALAVASQSIRAIFLASIILLIRRPFRRHDQICSNGHEGKV